MNALKTADEKTEVKEHVRAAALRHQASVYILVTSVQGSLMAAAHTTREAAMIAAVDWVEAEAETRLTVSLDERFQQAHRHVIGQGGQMAVLVTPIFGDD